MGTPRLGDRRPRRRRRHRAGSPAPPSRCGASPAQSDAVTDALAALDPTAPDLLARDVEQIWLARAGTAFMTNDPDEIERAAAWLHEREPRCGNPITEAWLLANIINGTLSAPDPALVARLQRLGQASPSPSVQAIAGFASAWRPLPEPQAGRRARPGRHRRGPPTRHRMQPSGGEPLRRSDLHDRRRDAR